MPIDIIDSFKLGSDLPLDYRYISNSIYDVSMYWFNGMQIYVPSSNKIWVVRDASNGIVEPLLFDFDKINGGSNWENINEDQVSGGTW